MQHLPRLLALSGILTLAACGGSGTGGGLGNIFGGGGFNNACDPGAQTQIVNPEPGQSGVPANIGQIIIVTNGNNNAIFNNPGNWHLFITDNFGGIVDSGSLNPYSYPGGPHPYGSDFYYSGSIPTLQSGMTYTVRLQEGSDGTTCSPFALQSFNT
jgi:hypothetical protein